MKNDCDPCLPGSSVINQSLLKTDSSHRPTWRMELANWAFQGVGSAQRPSSVCCQWGSLIAATWSTISSLRAAALSLTPRQPPLSPVASLLGKFWVLEARQFTGAPGSLAVSLEKSPNFFQVHVLPMWGKLPCISLFYRRSGQSDSIYFPETLTT